MKTRFLALIAVLLLPLASAKAQLLNGGFETGDFSGWTSGGTGSVQVLATGELNPIVALEGTFFALVGNGPGDRGSDGLPDVATLTSTPFAVVSNAVLSLSFDFLTAEFTGIDSDPDRLDAFELTLLPEVGSPIVLASGNVEISQPFSLIDGGGAVSSPDGSAFFERLGFQTLNIPVSSGTYTLRISVTDAGDGSFDSALAIDAITLTPTATAAPEPETKSFIVLGFLCVALFYRNLHKNICQEPAMADPIRRIRSWARGIEIVKE